jgi:hypothetical protein
MAILLQMLQALLDLIKYIKKILGFPVDETE